MLNRLKQKWRVGSGRLVLILITFACGGSLTGYMGRKLLVLAGIESTWLYIPLYIIVITILWPVTVLALSIPTGQFPFFLNYIKKLGGRFVRSKPKASNPFIDYNNPQMNSSNQSSTKQIAIFASGAGSNAQKIIDHFRGSSHIKVALIACNKPEAGVVQIAATESIPVLLIEKEKFFRGDGYVPELQSKNIDLIVLAGFLWKIPDALIAAFPRRIINIHPALLPKYGGKGMYGHHVHNAILKEGEVESGISIHFVDEHYDHGDIIFQVTCPVLQGDTPDSLAQRVHALEHKYYPQVIEQEINKLA